MGLVLAFFHNLESRGTQLQALSPWGNTSLKVDWQNVNELLSLADPALASLLLLRTGCLASAQQWFRCCLLSSLPCSSFSSLRLLTWSTVQDLAMQPEGAAAMPFRCFYLRGNLHLLQNLQNGSLAGNSWAQDLVELQEQDQNKKSSNEAAKSGVMSADSRGLFNFINLIVDAIPPAVIGMLI